MSENLAGSLKEALQSVEAPQAAPVAEPVEQKQPEVDYGTRFAALTRKEKELQQRESKYKKELEELRGKLNPYQEFESKKSLAKENPEILDEILGKHLGMSFEDILNLKVSSGTLEKKEKTPEDVYNEIMGKIEADKKAAEQEKLKQQEELDNKAIENFKNSIEHTAKQNADKYELLNYLGEYDAVYKWINEHYQETGELMSIEQGCTAIESHYEQLMEGAAKFNKIKSKFTPPVKQEAKPEEVEPTRSEAKFERKVTTPKTLTNSMQSQSSSAINSSFIHDVEESKRRAANLIKWS